MLRPVACRVGIFLATWGLAMAAAWPACLCGGEPQPATTGTAPRRMGVGLYGGNGHQLKWQVLQEHKHARPVAIARGRGVVPDEAGIRSYATLAEMLADPAVEIVSLCSPRRADQAADAILCLRAGKHVYAEKPCALTEAELDAILAEAKRAGREFHEMAGTAFVQPYAEMRRQVRAGAVGEVIQVFVQKSYPYGDHRPQDEALDGGLFLQAGIHAVRLVEHTTGIRMKSLTGRETAVGLPESGDCKMAASMQIVLENGGLASIIVNYLNPVHLKPRNHETLRVFGSKGFIESTDGASRTRLVTQTAVHEPLDTSTPGVDYFDYLAAHLAVGTPMPMSSDEELHPLRMLLRAKEQLRRDAAATKEGLPIVVREEKRPESLHLWHLYERLDETTRVGEKVTFVGRLRPQERKVSLHSPPWFIVGLTPETDPRKERSKTVQAFEFAVDVVPMGFDGEGFGTFTGTVGFHSPDLSTNDKLDAGIPVFHLAVTKADAIPCKVPIHDLRKRAAVQVRQSEGAIRAVCERHGLTYAFDAERLAMSVYEGQLAFTSIVTRHPRFSFTPVPYATISVLFDPANGEPKRFILTRRIWQDPRD